VEVGVVVVPVGHAMVEHGKVVLVEELGGEVGSWVDTMQAEVEVDLRTV
jgi:hypothetical protein